MGIGGEYAAINSAIDELIPARHRGRIDIIINGTYWLGAAAGALLSVAALHVVLANARLARVLRLGRRARPGDPARAPPRAGEPALAVHPRPRATRPRRSSATIERQVEREHRRSSSTSPTTTITITQRKTIALWRDRPHDRHDVPEAHGARPVPVRRPGVPLQRDLVRLRNAPEHVLRRRDGRRARTTSSRSRSATSLGPAVLGPLFDTVGRRPMIAGTYILSGVLLLVTG